MNGIDPWGLVSLNLLPWEPSAAHPGTRQAIMNQRTSNEDFNPPNVYSIAAHGGPKSIEDTLGRVIFPEDLAQLLLSPIGSDYHKGDPIVLVSCGTGEGDNSFAQQLSKLLNVAVIAPDDTLWDHIVDNPFTGNVLWSNPMTIGPTSNQNTGHWRRFTPDKEPEIVPMPQ